MQIRQYKQVLKSGMDEIASYQNRDKLLINTGYEMFEMLVPGSVVTLTGASFTGKTILLNKLKENIMSETYNANASKFIWLSNSLEMTVLMNTLRGLSFKIGKSKKEILLTNFEENELLLVEQYLKEQGDDRFYINEDPPTPSEFETHVGDFLIQHKDKELVGIDYDHTAITKGSDKKRVLDELYEIQNNFKKRFTNSLFIDVSQFNRNSLLRIVEKDELMKPNRGDLYQSDGLYQYSDFIVATSIPQRLGIDNYRLVSPSFYEYLGDHFGDFNTKRTKVSFQTYGRIFYEVMKNRFAEGVSFKDTFIEVIDEDNRPPQERQPIKAEPKKPKFEEEETITLPFKA